MRAYLGSDGRLHQYPYRIAYINKAYVYAIDRGRDKLVELPLWTVLPDLPVALVMEKFRAGQADNKVNYWNPVDQARLDAMGLAFRTAAAAKRLDKLRTDARNAAYEKDSAIREAERTRIELEKFEAGLAQERARWLEILERQAREANAYLAAGKKISSVFVHPGTGVTDEHGRLEYLNYETADVLSVAPDPSGTAWCLACTARFEDDLPGRTYVVPDYSLVQFHEHFMPESKGGEGSP